MGGVAVAAAGVLVLGGCGLWLARRVLSLLVVEGLSMAPALRPGQRVLVLHARLARVRGDRLVVLASDRIPLPGPPRLLVKRVAALPGERMPPEVAHPGTVPSGTVVVLGDNPPFSTDSRVWGPIPRTSVIGLVLRS